ncbi:hypothetical protein GALMADRAFT_245691 [Galerina marginata CBS 339.88]|uniref:Thiamine pyrophosphate enzyme TPP-binding domain-containing protein n=1 Tax=Galerina marginata (strain CBS 339.88) TaxID=685588 RepID=A0A067TCC6_GALM3|nr:hypothetical protein GALMADRAFT_245691 [Galerina marginata CBS 339.88]
MPTSTYTTSTLFLRTLARAGITHAFVNWGSDHPALLEDLERQRVEARAKGETLDEGGTEPRIVTCPNEMVALSAAQGFAQVTGKPAAVIVHVDVGTQALAGAVHNVDRSRTPVLIYAGASAISQEGEHKGSRNEWIMWIQDIPDQPAIVRQYMRHTAQIGSAKTVDKTVKRALQIANSDPKGPVYLWARREVMEEEVDIAAVEAITNTTGWPTIEPTALSPSATARIADALLKASSPLIITSNIGRSPSAVPALISLASLLSIPVLSSCPPCVNLPFSHPSYIGVTFLAPDTHWEKLQGVDVILVLECDLPWIPGNEKPQEDTRVFVVDGGDPLKSNVGHWHVDAEMICRADGGIASKQIEDALRGMGVRPAGERWELDASLDGLALEEKANFRKEVLEKNHARLVSQLDEAEMSPSTVQSITAGEPPDIVRYSVANIIGALRRSFNALTPSKGANILVLNESISNYPAVWGHLRPETLGSVISSGGSSLGWALGAAVGASLGARTIGADDGVPGGRGKGYDLIVAVVGDGSFMFGVPSSAYWMARRYETPFLTIVLNNGGWKSPKLSMLGVHPVGHGSRASGAELSVGFGPDTPDFLQIAVAASAGWAWGAKVGGHMPRSVCENRKERPLRELQEVMEKAVKIVLEEKRCAVVECVLMSI